MTGRGCSGLSQGAGDSGRGYGFLGRDPSPGVIAHPGLVSLCPGAPRWRGPQLPGRPGSRRASAPGPAPGQSPPYLREGAVWLELLGGGAFSEGV